MVKAWKAALEAYKKVKYEKKQKNRLLRKDIDYQMFQKMLNALADNQQRIGIDILFANGTIIKLRKETNHSVRQRDPYEEYKE